MKLFAVRDSEGSYSPAVFDSEALAYKYIKYSIEQGSKREYTVEEIPKFEGIDMWDISIIQNALIDLMDRKLKALWD